MASSPTSAATSAPPRPPSLGRVVLITGKEEFLGERTVADIKAAIRAYDGEAEISDAQAGDLTMASLGELSAPSLFSSTRCVIVRELENLPDESVDGLLDYAGAPADDVAVVLVHTGGQRGSGVLTKLRKQPLVTEFKSEEITKAAEWVGFATNEVRRNKGTISREAASLLVQAVGQDMRALAGAAHQLVADAAGPIDEALVRTYFGSRAEARSFDVADAAFTGNTRVALEELRWAMQTGTAPVLVTSAMAGSARGLARLKAAPAGMRDADLAREVGVPPWKLRTLRDQARRWNDSSLAQVIALVAQADADIKGAGGDPSWTLERLVLNVATLCTPR